MQEETIKDHEYWMKSALTQVRIYIYIYKYKFR